MISHLRQTYINVMLGDHLNSLAAEGAITDEDLEMANKVWVDVAARMTPEEMEADLRIVLGTREFTKRMDALKGKV